MTTNLPDNVLEIKDISKINSIDKVDKETYNPRWEMLLVVSKLANYKMFVSDFKDSNKEKKLNLKKCDICFKKMNSVENRCKICKDINICLPCHWNDLKGLCPICDREQLNTEQICCECYDDFHYKDIIIHNDCDSIICFNCFGNGTHNCVSENNSNNDSSDEIDNIEINSILVENKELLKNIKKNLAIITIQLFWKKYK